MHATKYLSTCDKCRLRKVRCLKQHEWDTTCIQCSKRQENCQYSPASMRQIKANKRARASDSAASFQGQSSLRPGSLLDSTSFNDDASPSSANDADSSIAGRPSSENVSEGQTGHTRADALSQISQSRPGYQMVNPSTGRSLKDLPLTASNDEPQLYMDEFILNSSIDEDCENERSIYTAPNNNVPSSSLSFFSENGLNSLCQRLGHDEVRKLVSLLEIDGNRRKLATPRSPKHTIGALEAPLEVQKLYIRSYFEQVNPIYPILDRDIFEEQAFSSSQGDKSASSDPLWSALYNAVLSLGSLYHDEASFCLGIGRPWTYFQETFRSFQAILVSRSSLLKVQTLALMAIFAGNYSGVHLETLCISEAARAVVTLGFHKKRLDSEPDHLRRRVFWVVYCLEKEYAFNSTQASLISDLDISCRLPIIQDPSLQGFDWLQCWARLSRLHSRVYDRCFSITATLNSTEKSLAVLDSVNRDLHAWRDTVPEFMRPESPLRQHRIQHPALKDIAVRIHLGYHNMRICIARAAIHVTRNKSPEQKSEIKRSLLLAARSIVEVSQLIPLEPFASVWHTACMPLVAMFILFDFVVYNPCHSETPRNISYLSIVAAHFSRLELASEGNVKAGFIAEFAAIAKDHVEKQLAGQEGHPHVPSTPVSPGYGAQVPDSRSGATYSHSIRDDVASHHISFGGTGEQPCMPPEDGFLGDNNFLLDYPDFPEGDNSLFMTMQHPVFDISDIFGYDTMVSPTHGVLNPKSTQGPSQGTLSTSF